MSGRISICKNYIWEQLQEGFGENGGSSWTPNLITTEYWFYKSNSSVIWVGTKILNSRI